MRRFKSNGQPAAGEGINHSDNNDSRMSGAGGGGGVGGGGGHMSLEEAIEATRYADLHGGIITADDFESLAPSEADGNREPVILNVYDMFW